MGTLVGLGLFSQSHGHIGWPWSLWPVTWAHWLALVSLASHMGTLVGLGLFGQSHGHIGWPWSLWPPGPRPDIAVLVEWA